MCVSLMEKITVEVNGKETSFYGYIVYEYV